jgi:hypothetical protein
MKRAARVFFHLAAGVSGVLFIVAVGFWIASYSASYVLFVGGLPSSRTVSVSRGEAEVTSTTFFGQFAEPVSPSSKWIWGKGPPKDLSGYGPLVLPRGRPQIAGFMLHKVGREEGLIGFFLLLPMPFVVALFAPLPLIDVILIRRRRRHGRRLAAGLCVRCGYDLRASPDRCPECGAIPAVTNST